MGPFPQSLSDPEALAGPRPESTSSTSPSTGSAIACRLSQSAAPPAAGRSRSTPSKISLSGQVIPVGGIKEKVLAAHRAGLARVVLPRRNRKQVDEDLSGSLRRAVAVDYVERIDELLDRVLQRDPATGEAAAAVTHRRRT